MLGSGKKVILVDTDMRKGRLHKIFNLSHDSGLSNCLSDIGNNGNSVNINKYIQKTNINNLHVMTSGVVPPNPSELLSSPNMKKFLEALNSQYDVVICDGTPCMLVSDSIILSKIVDTTVIVTANKTTKLDTLLKMKKSIENVGGNIGGVVINKMTLNAKSYKNGYYYGNNDELDNSVDFSVNTNDSILDNKLYINDISTDVLIDNSDVAVIDNNEQGYDFSELSNIMNQNLKEVCELKNLYKNVMQATLNTLSKDDSSAEIMNELSSMKSLYENNLSLQNEQIADLNKKIDNLKFEDDHSDVLNELENFKTIYKETVSKHQEYLDLLNTKIANLKIEDNSDTILNELDSIKSSYELAFDKQNEYIASLEDKIANFKPEDNSSIVLDELNSMKSSYELTFDKQNEYIASLEDKITNFKPEDNSSVVLDELNSMKSSYELAFDKQNEYIASLEDKIANFKIEDNSSVVLDELNSMKSSYELAFDKQNEYIASLEDKIANFKPEDNSELLKEIANIYKQLEFINNRFDSLETTARNNETLIKNINKNSKVSDSTNTKTLDIKKLNEKVIMIQDYLRDGYNNNIEEPDKTYTSMKTNKNVLDGQINMLDNILNDVQEKEEINESIKPQEVTAEEKSFVVDYERINKKSKKGFSIFKSKAKEPIYEEPIQIVSQILCGNNVEENVG